MTNTFIAGGIKGLLPLYNRRRIRDSQIVFVVEGEKDVHALHKVGIVATTKPCGSNGEDKVDWTPLYGKTVILWPDNDAVDPKQGFAPGYRYMEAVKQILLSHCKVRWIDPDTYSLPEKGDATDWCEMNNWSRGAALTLYKDSTPCNIADQVIERIKDIAEHRRVSINWPWTCVTELTQSLIPGSTSVICGVPGSKKSFWIMDAMLHWHEHNVKWCVYSLEWDIAFHMMRALAMHLHNADMADYTWISQNIESIDIAKRNEDWLNEFGRHIKVKPRGVVTKDEILDWCELKAKEGYRVIMIDPITSAEIKGDIWRDDKNFVEKMRDIATDYQCSIVPVTHPRSNRSGNANLNDMQGGAAWERHIDTALWIESVDDKEVTVVKSDEKSFSTINVIVHIKKSKLGKAGPYTRLGYWFNTETLRFDELGIITKKEK